MTTLGGAFRSVFGLMERV